MRRVSTSEKYITWYRRALHLFPERFRSHYGDEMTQLLRDQLRDAAHDGISPVYVAVHAFFELPGAIFRQHLANAGHDIPHATRLWRELRYILISLGLIVLSNMGLGEMGNGGYGWLSALMPWALYALPVLLLWHTFTAIRNLAISLITTALSVLLFFVLIAFTTKYYGDVGALALGFLMGYVIYQVTRFVMKRRARTWQSLPLKERARRQARQQKRVLYVLTAIAVLLIVPNIIASYDPVPAEGQDRFMNFTDLTTRDNSENALFVWQRLPGDPYGSLRWPQQFADWTQGLTNYMTTGKDDYQSIRQQINESGTDAFLTRTEKARSIAAEASTYPYLQILPFPYPDGSQFSLAASQQITYPENISNALRAVTIAASVHAERGDTATAQQEVVQVLHSVRQLTTSGYPQATFEGDLFLAWFRPFSTTYPHLMDTANADSSLYPAQHDLVDSYQTSLRIEAAQFIQPLVFDSGPESYQWQMPWMRYVPYFFQANHTLALAYAVYGRDRADIAGACPSTPTPNNDTYPYYSSFDANLRGLFTINGIGKRYVQTISDTHEGQNLLYRRCDVEKQLTDIATTLGLQPPQY